MISAELYDFAVKLCFKNKSVIHDFAKMYTINDISYEVKSFYLEKKQIGILFFHLNKKYYVTKITKSILTADRSGRIKPVICDLCYTRMPGAKIAQVTFERAHDRHSNTWLLCSDLSCSLNTRELTTESLNSKKILGENVSIEIKIERLEKHIANIVNTLRLSELKGYNND